MGSCCIAQGAQLSSDDLHKWDGGMGGREVQEGGDICINIDDTFHCTAEINTTL